MNETFIVFSKVTTIMNNFCLHVRLYNKLKFKFSLVGPSVTRPVQDPLAVSHFDKQLYTAIKLHFQLSFMKSLHPYQIPLLSIITTLDDFMMSLLANPKLKS